MSARREELTRIAARLFAKQGYQGTSLADLAEELGVQKPSLYHHIAANEDLLWEVAWEGANAFHAALDAVPAEAPAAERIRLALRGHLAVVAGQLDIATVFVREWR
ncbi:MAG TPA: helix-turn-helix domain-containing protein, partial [Gaiellaceae bacterium]